MTNFMRPKIDCDGVLASFISKAYEVLGMSFDEFKALHGNKILWTTLRDYRDEEGRGFYESLDLMPDARELFDSLAHLNPIILTGCPIGDWAPEQKIRWASRNFPGTQMITCLARDKRDYIEYAGDVLIDDTLAHRHLWEEAGGIFVHHTSTANTLSILREIKPEWFQ